MPEFIVRHFAARLLTGGGGEVRAEENDEEDAERRERACANGARREHSRGHWNRRRRGDAGREKEPRIHRESGTRETKRIPRALSAVNAAHVVTHLAWFFLGSRYFDGPPSSSVTTSPCIGRRFRSNRSSSLPLSWYSWPLRSRRVSSEFESPRFPDLSPPSLSLSLSLLLSLPLSVAYSFSLSLPLSVCLSLSLFLSLSLYFSRCCCSLFLLDSPTIKKCDVERRRTMEDGRRGYGKPCHRLLSSSKSWSWSWVVVVVVVVV